MNLEVLQTFLLFFFLTKKKNCSFVYLLWTNCMFWVEKILCNVFSLFHFSWLGGQALKYYLCRCRQYFCFLSYYMKILLKGGSTFLKSSKKSKFLFILYTSFVKLLYYFHNISYYNAYITVVLYKTNYSYATTTTILSTILDVTLKYKKI